MKQTINGKDVLIFVEHAPFVADNPNERPTKVTVKLPDGREYSGTSRVKGDDKFTRLDGRKHAAISCLRTLRNAKDLNTTKEFRRQVFEAVCPEFFEPSENAKAKIRAKIAKLAVELAGQIHDTDGFYPLAYHILVLDASLKGAATRR